MDAAFLTVQVILIALRLMDVIDWSWWVVLIPLWVWLIVRAAGATGGGADIGDLGDMFDSD